MSGLALAASWISGGLALLGLARKQNPVYGQPRSMQHRLPDSNQTRSVIHLGGKLMLTTELRHKHVNMVAKEKQNS